MRDRVPARSAGTVVVDAVRGRIRSRRSDRVAVEEPLEVRIRHGPERKRHESSLGLTMRTPGDDVDLVAGTLLSEGIASTPADIRGFQVGTDADGLPDPNVLVADLAPHVAYDPDATRRHTLKTSACGICGRGTLDDLAAKNPPAFVADRPRIAGDVLARLPDRLRGAQAVFEATGGLHAAALFTPRGRLVVLKEDIGRHNAVDKVVGARLLKGETPLDDAVLLVSGRAGYEILQKALFAGIPIVAAIGAPSSLAVDLAQRFGLTLVGFLRSHGHNIYAGPQRIASHPRRARPTGGRGP